MVIQTIDEKFKAAVSHINAQVPYYLRFYNLFKRQACTEEGVTLRVNMMDSIHPIVEYNPQFIDKINSATLAVLLCAEINRILLHHCTKRRMPNAELNYKASNIVVYDPSIAGLFNNCIESVQFDEDLPNDANPSIRMELPTNYNHDTDCQLEILYEMLGRKSNNGNNGNNNQGGGQQQQNQNGGGGNNGNQPQGNGGGKGKGKGQGNGGGNNPMRDALQQHFKNTANSDKWGDNDIANANIAQRVNTTDASQWGNMPGNLRERIMAANRQVVDPRVALRNFIGTAYSNNVLDSRMKYNRRLPEWSGIIPGKRHDQTFKLGIFADASGSMGSDDIKLCIDTVNDFIKFEAEVHFAWWDCSCEMPAEKLKPMHESNVSGGGGTDPSCIIDLIHKHKLHYDGIIVLTDCGFCWDRPKEYKNIFIIRTPTAVEAPAWVGKRQMSMKALYSYLDRKNK